MTSEPTPELQDAIRANVRAAIAEDIGAGDITARLIDPTVRATAEVVTRSPGVFCGAPWVIETCAQVDERITLRFDVEDGTAIAPGDRLFSLSGPARGLLSAERTMLNFAQLLSGTATITRHYVDLVRGTSVRLLDTRKTIPGLRLAQKYAVRCGGGHNHRLGLYDAFLIKENHLAAAGGIANAVLAARREGPGLSVEVEVETLAELEAAIAAGADLALIDNFDLADTRKAVALAAGRIELEASGNIDEASITEVARAGVDYISIGNLTKQVQPLDLSMRFTD